MRQTLTDRLESYFKARPAAWIRAERLMEIAGNCAWRTRVSDLRKRGLTIENHVECVLVNDVPRKRSYYRYVPDAERAVVETQDRASA